MQLIYRGVGYNYTPAAVETAPTALPGKFRGAALKFRNAVAKANGVQPALALIYRGASYTKAAVTPETIAQETETARKPVDLVYRGMRYTVGGTNGARKAETPKQEHIADECRHLIIQNRLNTVRRDRSVLGRFAETIETPVAVYDLHETAMS